ncbi:hypothetical protein BJ912DRAFT_1065185 [Pholiota molesta]|nr:hypothetical protein BJ912DRAFT_1065185 [Pholiota molesta]
MEGETRERETHQVCPLRPTSSLATDTHPPHSFLARRRGVTTTTTSWPRIRRAPAAALRFPPPLRSCLSGELERSGEVVELVLKLACVGLELGAPALDGVVHSGASAALALNDGEAGFERPLPSRPYLRTLAYGHTRADHYARHNIQLIFRTLKATQATERFPQLDWVLKEPGKTLIFCPTIRFGFKLAIYLWHLDPQSAVRNNTIRLFNSLNSPTYNNQTLKLLEGNQQSRITIATDKLSVGVDISDFQTVIIIDPQDLDDLWQKAGRGGRDSSKIPHARVIMYILAGKMKTLIAQSSHASESGDPKQKKRKRREEDEVIDSGLREVVLADCHCAELDRQYENPMSDPLCSPSCTTCSVSPPLPPPLLCNCSKCIPEEVPSQSTASRKPRKIQWPLNVRVTQDMRRIGVNKLEEFREHLWEAADESSTGMLPMESFLPGHIIESILDNFTLLLSRANIAPFINSDGQSIDYTASRTLLQPFTSDIPTTLTYDHSHELLATIWELHNDFDRIRLQKKDDAKAKRDAKRLDLADAVLECTEDNLQEPADEEMEDMDGNDASQGAAILNF